MQLLAKFRAAAAAMGFRNACLFAATRLLHACFGTRVRIVKYYFMTQPLTPPDQAALARSGSFAFSWIESVCPLFEQIDRPAEVLAQRFAQGARCLAALTRDDELAGFLWFVVGPYDEDEVRARFVPQPAGAAAWDFDVSIVPRYRMGRLFSYLWARASAELVAHGVNKTVSRVSAFNPASLASHSRLGAEIVGEALFLCAGRVQLMKSSLAPKWHLSWREDQRPLLSIG